MIKVLAKREKITLFLTLGVIIFALLFNFAIVPFLNRFDTLNKEITLAKAKLNKYARLLSQKEAIEKRHGKLFLRLQEKENNKDMPINALSELEGLAANSGIKIIDLRPQATVLNAKNYKETVIDMRAEGAMEGYLRFIYEIENSPLLFKVKRMQISAKSNSQSLEGSFTLSQILSP
ncbi:MAG: hypothetical protein KJ880_05830 [Candidatus Omnitrophica bacterium]|nr:hypothetical protein [Candidatus Omnitrophota bacterium]MBU1870246.1 hypothetical protein [Candidatus Omnitrophota bacterium]